MPRISITKLVRYLAETASKMRCPERITAIPGRRPAKDSVPTRKPGLRLGDLPEILASVPRLGVDEAERMGREIEDARAGLARRRLPS